MSLRIANKNDKRRRILSAAHRLFVERGFEATTVRAIADEAGVAVGTVALYADSKQALLQEVWRTELSEVMERALSQAEGKSLQEGAMALFEPFLAAYTAHPGLARVAVKELPWLEGRARASHAEDLSRFLRVLADLVSDFNRIESRDADPMSTAELLFSVYYGACVRLLMDAEKVQLSKILSKLRTEIGTIVKGLRGS